MKRNVQVFYIEGEYGEEGFCGSYENIETAKEYCRNNEINEGDIYEIHTEDFSGRWVSTDGMTWNWVNGWDL